MTTIDAAHVRLAVLRREAAELLALIDTSEYPAPTSQDGSPALPGPYWEVGENRGLPRWRVHALPEEPMTIFLGVRDGHWPSGLHAVDLKRTDVEPVPLAEARRLAMALLAACAWDDRMRKPRLRVEP